MNLLCCRPPYAFYLHIFTAETAAVRQKGYSEVIVSRFWFQLHVYALTCHICVTACFWVAVENIRLLRVHGKLPGMSLQIIGNCRPRTETSFLLFQSEGAVALFCRSLFLSFHLFHLISNPINSHPFSVVSHMWVCCVELHSLSERYKRRPLMIFLVWFGSFILTTWSDIF